MPTRRDFASVLGASAVGGALMAAAAPARAQSAPAEPGEATLDRIHRTGTLRIAVLPGEAPFFHKDLASGDWSGTAIDMAQDIAQTLDVKLDYVESTYANSVLDLQANKIDLAFALNPTPQRALAIGFSRPYYMHPFGYVGRRGFAAKSWDDLNKPEVRLAVLPGGLLDRLAKRYAPNAEITAYKAGDDAILAVQSGRADAILYGIIQALGVLTKSPAFDAVGILENPRIALPSALGVQQEPDRRWRDFLDNWVDFNRGAGQIREWFVAGLTKGGLDPSRIPADSGF